MTINFTETEIPASAAGRPAKDNPFLPGVKTANANRGKSLSTTVKAENADALDKRIAEIGRDLARAGVAENVTVRKLITKSDDGKSAKLTIWVIDRITRPRDKNDAATDAARAAE